VKKRCGCRRKLPEFWRCLRPLNGIGCITLLFRQDDDDWGGVQYQSQAAVAVLELIETMGPGYMIWMPHEFGLSHVRGAECGVGCDRHLNMFRGVLCEVQQKVV
jgi:hypothetical protein